jgi:hypothetical protein
MHLDRLLAARLKNARTLGLGMLTALAVIVAPLCASVCAAQACTSQETAGPCHDMAGMNSASAGVVAVHRACQRAELTAVLTKNAPTISLQQQERRSATPFSPEGLAAAAAATADASGAAERQSGHFVRWRDPALFTPPLRI